MKWILLISIHALREEGDYGQDGLDVELCEISIHALREEGDKIPFQGCKGLIDFYPRPPRGGRLVDAIPYVAAVEFLSTPSARRATLGVAAEAELDAISIHALREEGDRCSSSRNCTTRAFLSTPSARRATRRIYPVLYRHNISIHALREEGDVTRLS